MENLKGKCVLLCVTGGIAAYKIPNVASALRKAGAEVHVIMTQNATQVITPLTFETLTNNRCVVDTFARDFQYDVTHISLAQAADVVLKQHVNRETDKWNAQGTTTSPVQCMIFHALQAALIEETSYQAEQFALIHPGGAVGERLNHKAL